MITIYCAMNFNDTIIDVINSPWINFVIILLFIYLIRGSCEHYGNGAMGPYSFPPPKLNQSYLNRGPEDNFTAPFYPADGSWKDDHRTTI